MYFRCLAEDRGREFSEASGGLYERVTEDGELDDTEHGLTRTSQTPEVCCSRSPEAALLGAVQNRQTAGTYHIYETRADPDIDLSGESARDFAVLEEVRYRPSSMPVRFGHYTSVSVPRGAVEDVQTAYGRGGFSITEAEQVKERFTALIADGTYISD